MCVYVCVCVMYAIIKSAYGSRRDWVVKFADGLKVSFKPFSQSCAAIYNQCPAFQ